MKKIFLILLLLFPLLSFSRESKNDNDIQILKDKILKNESDYIIQQNKYESLTTQYQLTNDRLNNYLTYTGIIASVFGIFIAIAGIYIGFESLKSQNRTKKAIQTLEEAKSYVNDKKGEFDDIINSKKTLLEEDYNRLLQLFKDKLINDVEVETFKIKEIAEKKTEEIESYSIKEKNEKTLEMLERRLDFFENIGIPDDPEILFSKAQILREKKMHFEAINLLEKVIAKNPIHKDAYFYLGYECDKIKNVGKSIEFYKKHIEINPQSASAYNNIALGYKLQGDFIEALNNLNKAIEINNKSEQYYINKIDVLLKLKSFTQIIETYKILISINHEEKKYYLRIIYYLANEKRESETIEYYNKAIETFKTIDLESSNVFIYNKAKYFGEINKKEEAISIYLTLINENYKIENCHCNIALLKNDLGDKISALSILENGILNNSLFSFFYIYKAFIESSESINDAKQSILVGGDKINNEHYYFAAGRFFAQKKLLELSKLCYEKVIIIIERKLIENNNSEGDIMNYYETKVIQGASLDDFNSKYRSLIYTEKYTFVLRVIDILCDIMTRFSNDTKSEFIEQIKNLNVESKDMKEIDWNFDDMKYYIENNKNKNVSTFATNMIRFLKKEIKLNEI